MPKKQTIERSVPQQVRRAQAIINHVNHLEPAMREWLMARLKAEEAGPATLRALRTQGYR